MFNNISPLVPGQVPEHLVTDSPLFVDFVKTYYEYANQRNKAIGIIQNRVFDADIDYCEEEYVTKFYDVYGRHIPSAMVYDRRNFIKLLNAVYNAKGTEKALKLVFEAVFGETVDVTYPNDQVLRASDGVWRRENFITLKTEYGTIPASENTFFSFSNPNGDYSFESSKIDEIPGGFNRVYFNSYYEMIFVDNQPIYHYDTYGTLIYVGKLVYSPSRLVISNPGKNWLKGQAIVVPGSDRNTIGKVLNVDSNGGITALEILEYGYNHTCGQVVTVSAYNTKPISPTTNLVSTMVSFSPLVYNHVLTIHDHVEGVDEFITGTFDKFGVGVETFTQDNKPNIPRNQSDMVGFTMEEWLESRATFVVEYDRVVTTKGFYENNKGQLSNQNVKMQDNYFYQAFSYLLETARDIREYSDLLNITHPAGLKRFSKLTKTTDFLLTVDVSRTLSVDTIYLLSVYSAIDSLIKDITSIQADSVSTTEYVAKDFYKQAVDDLVTLSELYAKHLFKPFVDSVGTDDTNDVFDVAKVLTDSLSPIDTLFFNTDKVLTDAATAQELILLNPIKYFIDTVTVDHLTSTSTVVIQYAATDYFAEKYTPYSYTLTIG